MGSVNLGKNMICQAFERIWGFRYIATVIIFFFTMDIFMKPIRDYAVMLGEKTESAMLAFLFCNNYFLKMIMLTLVFFYSEVPYMEREEQYYFLRLGRIRFCIRNLVHIALSGSVLSITIWGISFVIMLPCISFENEWGRVSRTLALTNVSEGVMQYFGIPYKPMEKYLPWQLCGYGILVTALCFTLIGIMMYGFCLLVHKAAAVFLICVVVLLPNIMEQAVMYSVYFSPVSWMRCDMWRYGPDAGKPDLVYVFTAYMLLIAILGIVCLEKSRRVEFKE
jgi:hypothetical protein